MNDNKLQIYFVDKSKPDKDVSRFTLRCTGIREQAIGCIHAADFQLAYETSFEPEYVDKRYQFKQTSKALKVFTSEDDRNMLIVVYSGPDELQNKMPLIVLAIHELNPLPAGTEVEVFLDKRLIRCYCIRADGTIKEREIPTTLTDGTVIIYDKDGNEIAHYLETTEIYYSTDPHTGLITIKVKGICEQGDYKAEHVGEGISGARITIEHVSTYEE